MQPTQQSPLAAEAVAGVDDPALRALLAEHWEWQMVWAPTFASTLGDHRFDDKLAPNDAASIARYEAEQRDFLARARALDGAKLGTGLCGPVCSKIIVSYAEWLEAIGNGSD